VLFPVIFLAFNAAIFHEITATIAHLQFYIIHSGDAARSTYFICTLQLSLQLL
jgi:hypothetical protein